MVRRLWKRFLAWIGIGEAGPRKWFFLAAAVVLVLVGQWLEQAGGLEFLRDFASASVLELGELQPFRIAELYWSNLTTCPAYQTCDWTWYLNVFRIVGALMWTFGEVMRDASGVTLLVLLLSFGLGGGAVVLFWWGFRGDPDDWNYFDTLAVAVLIPVATSVAALVLQGVFILLFGIFGEVVGVIIAYGGYIGMAWSAIKSFREVKETADHIEAGVHEVAELLHRHAEAAPPPSGTPPPAPPKA